MQHKRMFTCVPEGVDCSGRCRQIKEHREQKNNELNTAGSVLTAWECQGNVKRASCFDFLCLSAIRPRKRRAEAEGARSRPSPGVRDEGGWTQVLTNTLTYNASEFRLSL
ncbi:hypothetical protein AOLI_G00322200 [Acnodon oligacanthus]